MDKVAFLRETQLFRRLTDDELQFMIGILKIVRYEPEEFIFLEGDEADAAYIVVEGEVRFTKQVAIDVEKTVFVAGAGDVFGEMGVLESERRSATAQALGEVTALWIGAELFGRVADERPEIGVKMLGELARLLSSRLRHTTELYSAAVAWGAEISGATRLDFHELIEDCRGIRFSLRSGAEHRGRIVRVDRDTRDITIQTDEGALLVLPYHAIDVIQIGKEIAQAEEVAEVQRAALVEGA